MSDNDAWDFGFTATTVEELDYIQESKSTHAEETDLLFNQIQKEKATNAGNVQKLEKLYNAILPLLTNSTKVIDNNDDYNICCTFHITDFHDRCHIICGTG